MGLGLGVRVRVRVELHQDRAHARGVRHLAACSFRLTIPHTWLGRWVDGWEDRVKVRVKVGMRGADAGGGGAAEVGGGGGRGALPAESHESAWIAASLSATYWPCAARFSAARFALFSLSSA